MENVKTTNKQKLLKRFEEKFIPVPETGCWIWLNGITPSGYGMLWANGKTERAHRIAYELYKGKIPSGTEIDHLCKVRCCVNPNHLEAVSHAENSRRSSVGDYQRKKTHCPSGHEYDGDNVRYAKDGSRYCATCNSKRALKFYYKRKISIK